MIGYHFTGDKLRNGKKIPKIGAWLTHEGAIIPCQSGLHMSAHPFDALQYAPGNLLHLVELDGGIQSHGDPIDKYVGRKRKIIKTIDATELLRSFARLCALDVIQLWDAPQVVRDYLITGDESLREEAKEAARAAWEAARAAQRARFAVMANEAFRDV